ncbi:rano class II histocompatibility antigen, A beta chain [Salmo salar]|uniref:Rano class II histocompatibility antigen, A beta chain n=1 Tax=Salmo salar TaxID=8030 RepID=A0A1S3QI87_SALSA|nr:rano class II histocompatibility antigen, A beta chain [Salmo salar]
MDKVVDEYPELNSRLLQVQLAMFRANNTYQTSSDVASVIQEMVPEPFHIGYIHTCLLKKLQAVENKRILSHRSMTPHSDRHPSMLTCSAYKFYPKQIRVTWLRNGQEVTSNMTSSEELANGDWHYQIHSYLEYTPTPGEKISCMVEHASFTEPKILHWDMSLPESGRNKIAIGASGLVLGVVFAAAGLLYYNRRKTTGGGGRELVPTSHPSQ